MPRANVRASHDKDSIKITYEHNHSDTPSMVFSTTNLDTVELHSLQSKDVWASTSTLTLKANPPSELRSSQSLVVTLRLALRYRNYV